MSLIIAGGDSTVMEYLVFSCLITREELLLSCTNLPLKPPFLSLQTPMGVAKLIRQLDTR